MFRKVCNRRQRAVVADMHCKKNSSCDQASNSGKTRRHGTREAFSLPVGKLFGGKRTSLYHTAMLNYINKTSCCQRPSVASQNVGAKQQIARAQWNLVSEMEHAFPTTIRFEERNGSHPVGGVRGQTNLDEPRLYPSTTSVEAIPIIDMASIFVVHDKWIQESKDDLQCAIELDQSCQSTVSSLGSGSFSFPVLLAAPLISIQDQSKQSPEQSSRLDKSCLLYPDDKCNDPAEQDLKAQYLSPLPPSVSIERNVEIDLSPGVRCILRGSVETWQAIQTNRAISASCACCNLRLCCVSDAEFVICPDCRVVSPLPDQHVGVESKLPSKRSGVGLGVKASLIGERN